MTKRLPSTVLITGASSGIGRALALHYASIGVVLFLCARNEARLQRVADDCRAAGAVVNARVLDVRDMVAMAEWISQSNQQTPLDLVIANAGISGGMAGSEGKNAHSNLIDSEVTREIFAVNLAGVLNTVLPAIEAMTAHKHGQIAIISSLAGLRGMPSAPAYSASKAAVKAYGEALRVQLAPHGIAVNVVCPGFIVSRITDANTFSMPMLMAADKAAAKIAHGLARNKARIAFPLPMYMLMWLISCLPPCMADPLLGRLPRKS